MEGSSPQAVGRSQDSTGKQGSLWAGKGRDSDRDRWQRPVVQTGRGGRGMDRHACTWDVLGAALVGLGMKWA